MTTVEWRDICERCHDVIAMPLDGMPSNHLCLPLPFEPRLSPEPCFGCKYRGCYHNDDCPKDTLADQEERRQRRADERLYRERIRHGNAGPSGGSR